MVIIHGPHAPTLYKMVVKLLRQSCSSFYCERNYST